MSPSVNSSFAHGGQLSSELDKYGQYKVPYSGEMLPLPVNTTSSDTISTTEKPYDGEGAMKFTVAVVMVYGVAVVGVFFMSYYGRKRQMDETDRQANSFLKNFEQVRHQLIKQKQVGSVSRYLRETSTEEYSCNPSHGVNNATKDMFKYMALPIFVSQEASDSGVDSEYVTPTPHAGSVAEGSVVSVSPVPGGTEHKLEIVEEKSEEDLDDNVFMTDEERHKYGVDFYVDLRESDIC